MWDMIDVSALPSNQSDMHSEISTHLDVQNRFWEHHPSSSVNHWDDFNRVCPRSFELCAVAWLVQVLTVV